MSKYLYLDTNEMKLLTERAKELEMVFKRPNDVLRDILGFGEKPKGHEHQERKARPQSQKKKSSRTKIRVDDDVWSAWKQIRAKARERSTLDQLIKELHERSEEQDTPRGRPPTK